MQDTAGARDRGAGAVARYLRGDLRADALAGLTVAVMGVPQAMAYALIAGLPPVYGLYTSIVTCAVAALLGSSRHLVTGPTNGLCMVMFSLTVDMQHEVHTPESLDALLQVILLLAFLSGVIQLAFGLLRLGGIVRYVSNSVTIGFTAGAGILIALNQLKSFLGFRFPDDVRPTLSYEVLVETVSRIGQTNGFALTVGMITAVLVVALPKLAPTRRLPAGLIGVVVAGATCFLLGWYRLDGPAKVDIVRDIGEIVPGLDIFAVPDFARDPDLQKAGQFLTGALAMAILGLIEATSISRAVARSSGQRLDYNRDFVGQGASKIAGAFFSCFAGSGSFTRTALCYKSGGRTRMAAVFSALWTLMTLLLLGGVANYIPIPALAGLLIVTAYSMVDRARLRMSWRSGSSSRLVLLGTMVATLISPLQYAILIGVALSLLSVLRATGKADLTQLVPRYDGGFDEVPFGRAAPAPVVTVNMAGDIYFAAAEDLDSELLRCITPETRVVVLRMKRLRAAGSTAMSMLEQFWTMLRERNIVLVVSGIEKQMEDVLTRSGVRKKIGESNIFFADNKLFQSFELAMARARSIAEQFAHPVQTETVGGHRGVQARDLMSTRCIRFGNRHQVREAVWLMSELHKHVHAINSEPLFLQDQEGRLFGELTPWRILRCLAQGTSDLDTEGLTDEQVAILLRRDFTQPIRLIARTDVQSHELRTPLALLVETAVSNDQRVIPICDGDQRIKGLVSADDLLRGLGNALGLPPAAASAIHDSNAATSGADGRLRARGMMLTEFTTIRADQSLAEAMQLLIAAGTQPSFPNALVVVGGEGAYVGFLTARLLIRSLLSLWLPETSLRDDPERHERELYDAVRDRLHVPVRDALVRGVPSVTPDARLLAVITAGVEKRLEFMPVVEDGVAVGVLAVRTVFQAAAKLALTPDDEGIRFDQ